MLLGRVAMKRFVFFAAAFHILALAGIADAANMRMEGEVKASCVSMTPAPTPAASAAANAGSYALNA
jgi:hypothetical protein